MSHNKLTVVGQSPNASSEISVALNNLSDVSISSPSSDQIIKYDGSNFVNAASTSEKGYDLKFATFQGAGNYSVHNQSAYQYVVGDYTIYRLNGGTYTTFNETDFTANNATAANSPVTTSVWTESVNIPSAGTYLVTVTGICRANDITYQIEGNNGAISAKIFCDRDSFFGSLAVGIVTVASTDVVRLVVKAVTGSVVFSTRTDQDFFTFNILKLA